MGGRRERGWGRRERAGQVEGRGDKRGVEGEEGERVGKKVWWWRERGGRI